MPVLRKLMLALLILPASVPAQRSSEAINADLAPGGKLRAAINFGNAVLAQRDPATGEPAGISVDLARELSRRTGLPLQLVTFQAAGDVTAPANLGRWDVAFLAVDPARGQVLHFSAPYLLLQGVYLLPPGSPIHNLAEVDRPGVRIAVAKGSAYDLYLTRNLKAAELVRAADTVSAFTVFLDQRLEVAAGVRAALVMQSSRLPGSTILQEPFMAIPQAVAVPQGRERAAQYIDSFVEDLKQSGFVAASMKRHGMVNEAVIAQPAVPKN